MLMEATVELMLSDNYKDRFKAEYHQLKIRYERLENMLKKWDAGELQFKPTCNRDIYDIQINAMKAYLDVLEQRAEIEGVVL